MNKNISKDKKNMLSHLSFEDYFESDWRKHFQEQETIQNIMNAAGLSSSYNFVETYSRHLIDDNRVSVIVLVRRKNTEVLDKLIIDVIAGGPMFEQCMEVLYNVGSDCDHRLILYDVNTKNYSKGIIYCHHLMCKLMDHFKNLVSMSLIGVDCIITKNSIRSINFKTFKRITKDIKISKEALPDRRVFEESEFWGPYAGSYLGGDFPCTYGFEITGPGSSGYDDPEIKSVWTDDGIVIEIRFLEMDEQEFNRLIEKHKDWLYENLQGCSIGYKDGSIIIKKDIPFRNFAYSLPKDKQQMVEDFFSYERLALHYVDECF